MKAPSTQTTKNVVFAIAAVAALILGYVVVHGVLVKVGLLKSEGERKSEKEMVNPLSAWNPQYWKSAPSGAHLITESLLQSMMSKIHGAFTLFQDDFDTIYAQFQILSHKSQVSYLADRFQQKYGESLLAFLQDGGGILPWDGLNSTHMKILSNYVNNLPA